ncbi:MAG: sugar ABC transporter substrate-binding protein [Candidatus Humimicrobiaceae bacterium]
MKKKWNLIAAMILTVAMLISLPLTGCKTTTAAETTAAAAETTAAAAETTAAAAETTAAAKDVIMTPYAKLDGKGMTLGIYVNNLSNPFFAELSDGAKAAAEKWGVKLLIGASPGGVDQADQVRVMEDWIQMKVNVIGTCPPDPAGTVPVIAKAVAAGIPVITFADDAPDSARSVFISANQYEGGRLQGIWIATTLGGQGKVAIIEGNPGNTSNEDRKKGVHDVLNDYPDIIVTRTIAGNWDQAQGMTAAEDILTADPDLNAIIAINDAMALGAVQAVKSANKLGIVKVIGFNGARDALESIKNGELDGTVVTNPYDYGFRVVEWAVRLFMGDTVPNQRLIPSYAPFADQQLVKRLFGK